MSATNEGKPLTLAFIFTAESGQANIHIAILEYLLSLPAADSPPLHIHAISFGPTKARVEALRPAERHTLEFHSLGERSFYADFTPDEEGMERTGMVKPFTKGGLRPYGVFAEVVGANPDKYLEAHRKVLDIFERIKPIDLAVVDILMFLAQDACKVAGVKFGILSPVSSLDGSRSLQPGLRGFWKYPAMWTALPYPVPMHLIPLNLAANVALIYTCVTHPALRALDKGRNAAGLKGSILAPMDQTLPFVIVPSVLEMEYPHVPLRNAVFTGPLIPPHPTVSAENYPDLAAFLARGRTVVVNMATLFRYTERDVRAVASAVVEARGRTRARGGFQVLWKLPHKERFEALLKETLSDDKEAVRVEKWIEPPALALLEHPNVVCLVNHGGANSVHEAACAGVTQIILPQWADLYDFAMRVELLGHGIYGNKGSPAEIDAAELADALERIMQDGPGERGAQLHARAKEIGAACKKAGGVRAAAEAFLKHAGGSAVA